MMVFISAAFCFCVLLSFFFLSLIHHFFLFSDIYDSLQFITIDTFMRYFSSFQSFHFIRFSYSSLHINLFYFLYFSIHWHFILFLTASSNFKMQWIAHIDINFSTLRQKSTSDPTDILYTNDCERNRNRQDIFSRKCFMLRPVARTFSLFLLERERAAVRENFRLNGSQRCAMKLFNITLDWRFWNCDLIDVNWLWCLIIKSAKSWKSYFI